MEVGTKVWIKSQSQVWTPAIVTQTECFTSSPPKHASASTSNTSKVIVTTEEDQEEIEIGEFFFIYFFLKKLMLTFNCTFFNDRTVRQRRRARCTVTCS